LYNTHFVMTAAEKIAHQLFELSMNLWWAWNPSVIAFLRPW